MTKADHSILRKEIKEAHRIGQLEVYLELNPNITLSAAKYECEVVQCRKCNHDRYRADCVNIMDKSYCYACITPEDREQSAVLASMLYTVHEIRTDI